MKFEKVIAAAGLKPNDFPEVSKIEVEVFDWKNREIKEEDFVFAEPIFANNLSSINDFSDFLKNFNTEANTIHHIILFEKELIITTSTFPRILDR